MILAIDVAYTEHTAQVAGIVFEQWGSATHTKQYVIHLDSIADYESGQFYKRELPCILALLEVIQESIDMVIVDGYVFLGAERKAGLGQHLYHALDNKIQVIGVAKNEFKGTPSECALLRGKSIKPLYVTSVGIDLEHAKQNIQSMFGKHRIPELLKRVDQLSRQ